MSFDPTGMAQEIVQAAVEAASRLNRDTTEGPRFHFEPSEVEPRYHALVEPLFRQFTSIPDPSSYDGVITDLKYAMHYLSYSGGETTDPINKQPITANGDLAAIKSAADELYTWDGEAAKSFKVNFLDPLPSKVTNQFLMLGVLKGASEADREVWDQTRKDLINIRDRTIEALDAVGGSPPNGFQFTLSVIGTVAAGIAIPFTAGTSATVAAALGAASMAAGTASVTEETVQASVGSPEQILQSMSEAIGKLCQQIRAKQTEIGKVLADYAGEAAQQDSNATTGTPYVPPRPRLATMEGAALRSDEGVGMPD